MSLIDLVTNRLNDLGIQYDHVFLSPRPNKKIRIIANGKSIDFGDKNSITYLEGASQKKRNAYIARHSKIYLRNGKRAIDIPYSPAWLSFYVLW